MQHHQQPYQHRRDALEALLGRGLPPGLVLAPSTTDPAVARSWLIHHGSTGIEGVVAKRLDQTYRPGVRGWQKLRTRLTLASAELQRVHADFTSATPQVYVR